MNKRYSEDKILELQLSSHETREEKSKKVTVYEVTGRAISKMIKVQHRYRSFVAFLDKVKKYFPNLQNTKLPQRKLFSVKSDTELIKERKEMLTEFLLKLSLTEGVMENPEFMIFFGISAKEGESNESFESSKHSTSSVPAQKDAPLAGDDVGLGETQNIKAKPTDFSFLKVIGKGSFGRVYLAKHNTEGTIYAVKVLDKETIVKRNETRHIMAERGVLLKNVKHPFLVALHYSFQTSDKLYFVLDYVNGGELFFHLQKERVFSETRTKFYAAEIGLALGYLHSLNIIYRDLKPENILLDSQGHIILTDFGLAKQCLTPNQTTTTFCGTPEYLAPEILMKQPYDKSVDWWCYGCVIYEMLSGLPPFYSRDTPEMYNNILDKPLRFKPNMSVVSKSFIEALVQKDRTRRLGAGPNDFEDIKMHAFLRRVDWDDVYHKRVKPPFNPNVSNELDLKNIDKEFVNEQVTSSVKQDNNNPLISGEDNPFTGFTYVQDNDILQDESTNWK